MKAYVVGGEGIFTKQETHISVGELKIAVDRSLEQVRLEMDEHIDAINQNASETFSSQTKILELEKKIEKLSDKMDELFMLLAPDKQMDFSSISLSLQEQEVFMILYGCEGPVTPEQVGQQLGLNKQLAAQYLYNLQVKGVPMMARNWKGELFYSLDLKFKDLQSRKNVLRISSTVKRRFAHLE